MKEKYIMALDQGTTSSRCMIFNRSGEIVSQSQREFTQIYPRPGYVEHDPMEIWGSQIGVAVEAMRRASIDAEEISSIGITNQRETTVLWDKNTGLPVYNAIVWQCRRTADLCSRLKAEGLEETVNKKTGLVLDPYFSGTKIKWILDYVDGVREKAEKG
ncbi:MAG: glycerol kinase, partial [Lachnospiraceae bacterium]|nr:glycerol kinase [Lachnospiraceae bacterium]